MNKFVLTALLGCASLLGGCAVNTNSGNVGSGGYAQPYRTADTCRRAGPEACPNLRSGGRGQITQIATTSVNLNLPTVLVSMNGAPCRPMMRRPMPPPRMRPPCPPPQRRPPPCPPGMRPRPNYYSGQQPPPPGYNPYQRRPQGPPPGYNGGYRDFAPQYRPVNYNNGGYSGGGGYNPQVTWNPYGYSNW